MPIEKIKLSKEKQRDEDIMGKIQILNATTGSMHTKDSTDRYFSIMNDIEEVMSLQSEMFHERTFWRNRLNREMMELKIDEVIKGHAPVLSLFLSQEKICPTISRQQGKTIFYICIACEDGQYLPLLVERSSLSFPVMLYGAGADEREAEENFAQELLESFRDSFGQFLLILDPVEYILKTEIVKEGKDFKISFSIDRKNEQFPYIHDSKILHARIQEKIRDEISKEDEIIKNFLAADAATEEGIQLDSLCDIMEDYIIKKNISKKILSKSVTDWSRHFDGAKWSRRLFPFDTLNFLLLPEVNALDQLSNKNNAYIYYAIDYQKDFSQTVFLYSEQGELREKFFNL